MFGPLLRKHLTLDSVRHKDRMSDEAPRQLSNPIVLAVVKSVEWIVHPLVPEQWRVPLDNKRGVIKMPIAVCIGNLSHIYVLDGHTNAIYSARMHYPVQVKLLYKGFTTPISIHFTGGLLFVVDGVVKYIDHNNVLKINPSSLKRAAAQKLCTKYKLI